MTTAQERVARGVGLLSPNWYREVDAARLNIARPGDCTLGQLYGGYGEGIATLGIGSDAASYGFNAGGGVSHEELTIAWREEIARRRLAEIPQPVAV
jgi:hypothetical protein